MSVAHTTPAPTAPIRRSSLLRRIGGGTLTAALLTSLAIAVWPASEVDKARADGEQLGEAVAALYAADSAEEVDAALTDISTAAVDTREHAGDAVADQVNDQADALSRAADGFVGAHTTDDEWETELYQAQLEIALDDLTSQAEEFRTTGPEVQQAFWDGVDTGLAGS